MVNKEILGGLRLATSKGDSLRKAMTTFYNAGYIKEEIEEAARELGKEGVKTTLKQVPETKPNKPIKKEKLKSKKLSKEIPKQVSAYGKKEKPMKKRLKVVLIVLGIFALIIVGTLIAFFIST